ncbi:MAG: hypothetical protein ACKV2T_33265 [Kofleriaceae bacterium]
MRRETLLVLFGACAEPTPPAQPSWQVDVMPILGANCVRCHGPERFGYASPLRLDSFTDVPVVGDPVGFGGASSSAVDLARRIRFDRFNPAAFVMPPDRELGDYEVAVLRNWAGNVDGQLRAPRGPGRPDNRAPTLAFTEKSRDATTVVFAYDLADADGDLVVGTLRGLRMIGDRLTVVGTLASGRKTVTIDITGVAPGSYELVAELDDGADVDGPDADLDFIAVTIPLVIP